MYTQHDRVGRLVNMFFIDDKRFYFLFFSSLLFIRLSVCCVPIEKVHLYLDIADFSNISLSWLKFRKVTMRCSKDMPIFLLQFSTLNNPFSLIFVCFLCLQTIKTRIGKPLEEYWSWSFWFSAQLNSYRNVLHNAIYMFVYSPNCICLQCCKPWWPGSESPSRNSDPDLHDF